VLYAPLVGGRKEVKGAQKRWMLTQSVGLRSGPCHARVRGRGAGVRGGNEGTAGGRAEGTRLKSGTCFAKKKLSETDEIRAATCLNTAPSSGPRTSSTPRHHLHPFPRTLVVARSPPHAAPHRRDTIPRRTLSAASQYAKRLNQQINITIGFTSELRLAPVPSAAKPIQSSRA